MERISKGRSERSLPERFLSLSAYNAAYPQAAFPDTPEERAVLRRFEAAGQGIVDDIVARDEVMSIDFLPDGAPGRDEPDRVGSVVASVWGTGPVYVLAADVPLRAASQTITAQWPTTLSAVISAMSDLRRYGASR